MRGSFSLGRIAGIQIGVHYTWLLAFFVIAWSLAVGFFPFVSRGDTGTYWLMGIAGALLLFISVLIHELAHSLVATARGLNVKGIVLFIFGGVSNIEGEPEKPQVELVMSIVGPMASLALVGVFWLLAAGFGQTQFLWLWSNLSGQSLTPAVAMFVYLYNVNLLLAAFNLLPGFPLDGGRVLRSLLWGATNNLVKATNIAATVGQVFGWALIAFGVVQLFAGAFLNGLWIAFIGWFLSSAAETSRREVTMGERLSGIQVKDVMNPAPECVNPEASVDDVVRGSFIQRGRRAVPVCRGEELAGIVTLTDVKRLPHERWDMTPVREIMTRSPLQTVNDTDDLNTALKVLGRQSLNQVPVTSGGRLVGLLSRSDVINYLQMSQELGVKPKKAV